jgi:hypothetical protein
MLFPQAGQTGVAGNRDTGSGSCARGIDGPAVQNDKTSLYLEYRNDNPPKTAIE